MPKIIKQTMRHFMDSVGRMKLPRYDQAVRNAISRRDMARVNELYSEMPFTNMRAQLSLGSYTFLDIETTGLDKDKGHEIVEIFALTTDLDLNPQNYFYSLVRPSVRVSYGANCAHGLSNEVLYDAPLPNDVFPRLAVFLRGTSKILGYNVDFDLGFLSAHIFGIGSPRIIDVLEIVKEIYPKNAYKIESYRLEEMIRLLNIRNVNAKQFHSPVEDIKATYYLYQYLANNHPLELCSYLSRYELQRYDKKAREKKEEQYELNFSSAEEKRAIETLKIKVDGQHLTHPLLREQVFLARGYQLQFAARAVENDLVLGLDTSLGKLNISLLAAISLLAKDPTCQIIYLVPRLEIIANHLNECEKLLNGINVGSLSSRVSEGKQKANLETAQILFGTPETICKLAHDRIINWEKVALLVVDEAHIVNQREEGREITKLYKANRGGRVLLLTATPGAKREEAISLAADYGIAPHNIYNLTRESRQVNFPYVREVESIKVDSPPVQGIEDRLLGLMIKSVDNIFRSGRYFKEDQELVRLAAKLNAMKEYSEEELRQILIEYFSSRYQKPAAIYGRTNQIIEEINPGRFRLWAKRALYPAVISKYFKQEYRQKIEELKSKRAGEYYALLKESAKLGTLHHLMQYLIYGQPYGFKTAFAKFWENKENKANIRDLREEREIKQIYSYLMNEQEQIGFPALNDFFCDYRIRELEKFTRQYKQPEEKVLILVKNRERAKFIADNIINNEVTCRVLWGGGSGRGIKGFTAKQKAAILQEIIEGEVKILVATEDVLGLGVTIPIDYLIIDTPPLSPMKFIQEIGRVARTKDGKAYYLVGSHPVEQHLLRVREYGVQKMKKELSTFSTL